MYNFWKKGVCGGSVGPGRGLAIRWILDRCLNSFVCSWEGGCWGCIYEQRLSVRISCAVGCWMNSWGFGLEWGQWGGYFVRCVYGGRSLFVSLSTLFSILLKFHGHRIMASEIGMGYVWSLFWSFPSTFLVFASGGLEHESEAFNFSYLTLSVSTHR